MKNKLTLLFTFFALFAFASPVYGFQAAEGTTGAVEAKADAEGTTGAEAPAATTAGDTTGAADTTTGGEAAPVEANSDEEAVAAAKGLYSAIADRNWALAVAFGLTLLVFGLRKLKVLAKVPAKAVPWVTAALAIAGYVAAALMAPGAALGEAALTGLAAGASAVGLWEMVLKHLFPAQDDSDDSDDSDA